MTLGQQLELRNPAFSEWERLWQELRILLRTVVDGIGVKQVAYDLDVQPSALVNALEERDRHAVKASWLPYLLAKAPNNDALEMLARLRGMELHRAKPVTPEEQLAALRDALDESLGPDLKAAVLERARRKAAERNR